MSLGLPPVTTELPCQRDLGGCGALAGQPCKPGCRNLAKHQNKVWKPDFSGVAAGMVKIALVEIEECDQQDPPNYERRYELVWMAVYFATLAGLKTGVALDQADPDWPVVYIELPTGQVSWHVPAHETPWDKHTTEEKYARCRAWEPDVAGGKTHPNG